MTISKDTAGKMARQIVAKNRVEVDILWNDFTALLISEYNCTIPKAVTDCFKKNKEYFRTTTSIGIKTDGNYYRYHTVKTQVICNDGSNATIQDKDATEKARLLLVKHEKALTAYTQLLNEIEAALLTLKTPKRIIEQFPEAEQFLPNPPSHAIVVNLDKIRKQIQTAK